MQKDLQEGREKQYHFILKMIKSNQLSYESCVENVEDKDDFVAWYQEHKKGTGFLFCEPNVIQK